MSNQSPATVHVLDASASRPDPHRVTMSWLGVSIAAAIVASLAFGPFRTLGAYLAIVCALVVLHEGAHLVAALRCGLNVEEYSVGFGPAVVQLHTSKMTWSLRSIPVGGFVKISGSSESSELPEGVDESVTLRGTSPMRRVVTIAAGPLSNLVAAVVLSAVAFGVVGGTAPDGTHQRLAPMSALSAGVSDLSATVTSTLSGLGAVVSDADGYAAAVRSGNRDEAPAAFLSPVGAADMMSSMSEPYMVLRFAAVISAGLGVFNLLPFPPLDGGHLALEVVDAIRSRFARRRVRTSDRVRVWAATATLSFFFVLTVTGLRFDLAS